MSVVAEDAEQLSHLGQGFAPQCLDGVKALTGVVRGRFEASPAAARLHDDHWASQALIWTAGPKVQAAQPPYAVLNRPLFGLFWVAIAGAVLASAAVLIGIHQRQRGRDRALGRISAALAIAAAAAAAGAGTAAVLAAYGVAERAALGILTPALNLGGLMLLIALILAGIATPRAGILTGWRALLPATLALLTLLVLGAILASGTEARAGLVLADAVVIAAGAVWVLLGWVLWTIPSHTNDAAEGVGRRKPTKATTTDMRSKST